MTSRANEHEEEPKLRARCAERQKSREGWRNGDGCREVRNTSLSVFSTALLFRDGFLGVACRLRVPGRTATSLVQRQPFILFHTFKTGPTPGGSPFPPTLESYERLFTPFSFNYKWNRHHPCPKRKDSQEEERYTGVRIKLTGFE